LHFRDETKRPRKETHLAMFVHEARCDYGPKVVISVILLSISLPPLMLKRMTSKLHLGGSKSSTQYLPPTPVTPPSTPSTSTCANSLLDYRGSISTARTSTSDWSKRGSSLESFDSSLVLQNSIITRPKGTYRLSDFTIQRTLGTGSFGRVHLGTHCHLASYALL
jgi:protein kinase A